MFADPSAADPALSDDLADVGGDVSQHTAAMHRRVSRVFDLYDPFPAHRPAGGVLGPGQRRYERAGISGHRAFHRAAIGATRRPEDEPCLSGARAADIRNLDDFPVVTG